MLAETDVWAATLQALANLAAIVTVASGLVAAIALLDNASVSETADAAGLGIAIGFLPGLVIAVYVYLHVAMHGLSP